MKYSAKDIQDRIRERLPEGIVVPEHSSIGHFYRIMTPDKDGKTGNVYPSVTGKLQILKDESLINYKKNQVIQYIFRNFKKLTEENLMEQLALAERVPEDILADASDIGTQIHDCRQLIFTDWIKTGVRPGDFLSFIKPEQVDVRLKSAIRALSRFCDDYEYVPVATELFVYSHRWKIAGTLDDIGFIRDKKSGEMIFILMDLKSSNQIKDHYYFQVSMYFEMLWRLIGIQFKPRRCIILKLSKEDGTYKIEDLKQPTKLSIYAHSMLRTNDAQDYIKSLRKDNQKNVAELIKF